jgi:flagellar hook-associated protein 3 FlgL
MFPNVNGSTELYLANLERNQNRVQQIQTEITSGLRVQQASDDPAAVPQILQLRAELDQNKQTQQNLTGVTTEVQTADAALQNALSVLDQALSLAAEGANSFTGADQRSALAQQVIGIQQSLLNVANTQVDGRYIFSGDQDSQPAYQLDSTQTEGVAPVANQPSTRVIADSTGTTIAVARTAQEIFDPKNADGTPASNNTFAAIQNLINGLSDPNDATALTEIQDALTQLHAASQYVNNQLAFYGNAENRIANALDLAQKFQTQQTEQLSQLQDADVATLAVEMNLGQVQNQAALSVEANMLQSKNLFSYIG